MWRCFGTTRAALLFAFVLHRRDRAPVVVDDDPSAPAGPSDKQLIAEFGYARWVVQATWDQNRQSEARRRPKFEPEVAAVRILGSLLVLIAATASSLSAQTHAQQAKFRNDCRLAEQVVSTGEPGPRSEWAHQVIRGCGLAVWGRAGAAEIRRLRAVSDTGQLATAWRNLRFVRDGSLFEAAIAVAHDRSASEVARLYAIAHLAVLQSPRYDVEPANLIGPFNSRGWTLAQCFGTGYLTVPVQYRGVPLPPDWRARVKALGEALFGDHSESDAIRSAADCLATSRI
jgi:hypothetical protein